MKQLDHIAHECDQPLAERDTIENWLMLQYGNQQGRHNYDDDYMRSNLDSRCTNDVTIGMVLNSLQADVDGKRAKLIEI